MEYNPYEPPAPSNESAFEKYSPQSDGVGTYEFDQFENETIARLARRAKAWGIISAVGGVLGIIAAIAVLVFTVKEMTDVGTEAKWAMYLVSLFVAGVACVSVYEGSLYFGAGKSFSLVVETVGDDVGHAVTATEKLGKAIWLEFWLKIAGIAAAVLLVIVAVIASAATS